MNEGILEQKLASIYRGEELEDSYGVVPRPEFASGDLLLQEICLRYQEDRYDRWMRRSRTSCSSLSDGFTAMSICLNAGPGSDVLKVSRRNDERPTLDVLVLDYVCK